LWVGSSVWGVWEDSGFQESNKLTTDICEYLSSICVIVEDIQ
jgi:hypothetical protein